MPRKAIESVFEANRDRLISLPGVVGTAIGEYHGEPCITVFVAQKHPELFGQVPSAIEGYAVVIQETGELRALDDLAADR